MPDKPAGADNLAKVTVGLYGSNGHQIQRALLHHPAVALAAVAGIPEEELSAEFQAATRHASLTELADNPQIDLISLCSPRRSDQAQDAILCLRAGKHVYAEKPCALAERNLNEIIQTSRETGRRFHEQAGTAFQQPYRTLRDIVRSGVLGPVVQVHAEKSYPWHAGRPQDERVDGGLARQAGVYCARFVEHVAGVAIKSVTLRETTLGNPAPDGTHPAQNGACRRAAAFLMELENGGLATGIANYLCPAPPFWERWGYETLRIWGENGFVEAIDGGRIGTLAVTGAERRALDFSAPGLDYLNMFLEEIRTGEPVFPLSLEQELSPTRWAVRAKEQGESQR